MRVIIGCEESQVVTKAFREKGHEAYSCDVQPCSGGHPEWHLQCDIREVLYDAWDLGIFHPPCDFLSNSGNRWLYHPDDKERPHALKRPHPNYPTRWEDRDAAILFFKLFQSTRIKYPNAIENPIPHSYVRSQVGNYSQVVQPWMFGDPFQKATCLWLYKLPPLMSTDITSVRDQKCWKESPGPDRKRIRSTTYPGLARAFADQWA